MRLLIQQEQDVKVYTASADIDLGADGVRSALVSYTSGTPVHRPTSYPGENTVCKLPPAKVGLQYHIMNNGPIDGLDKHKLVVVAASGDVFGNISSSSYQNALLSTGGSVIVSCVKEGEWVKCEFAPPV